MLFPRPLHGYENSKVIKSTKENLYAKPGQKKKLAQLCKDLKKMCFLCCKQFQERGVVCILVNKNERFWRAWPGDLCFDTWPHMIYLVVRQHLLYMLLQDVVNNAPFLEIACSTGSTSCSNLCIIDQVFSFCKFFSLVDLITLEFSYPWTGVLTSASDMNSVLV